MPLGYEFAEGVPESAPGKLMIFLLMLSKEVSH